MKQSSKVNLPFSWGNELGISNLNNRGGDRLDYPFDHPDQGHLSFINLPPPPCPKVNNEDSSQMTHQPPLAFRSSSRRGLKKKYDNEDPFLAAMKECTKSINGDSEKDEEKMKKKKNKGFSPFSCKRSISVRDDNLVRVSHHQNKKDGER